MWEWILYVLAGIGGLSIVSCVMVCVLASNAAVDNEGWAEKYAPFAYKKPADPVREKSLRLVELRQRNRADVTATVDRMVARAEEAAEMLRAAGPDAQLAAIEFVKCEQRDDVEAATILRDRLRVASGRDYGMEPS